MLTVPHHVSENVINNAFSALIEYYSGKKIYHVIKPYDYFTIKVSYRWQLLSKDSGKHWELMTHERYSKQCKI
ncbi:hypothetical protein [Enterobacter ludwigii]|uniref:ParE family toxin-like protein n=1 Tax=Enterobacter ludwigii TaxID=299767 RepID=UPI003B21AE62